MQEFGHPKTFELSDNFHYMILIICLRQWIILNHHHKRPADRKTKALEIILLLQNLFHPSASIGSLKQLPTTLKVKAVRRYCGKVLSGRVSSVHNVIKKWSVA